MASRSCSLALAKRARRALRTRERLHSVRIVIIVTPTERPAMPTARPQRLIRSMRNRQTGTIIDLFDRGSNDDGGGRYETICVDHGTVCSHATRALAVRFASSPLDWCEDCMNAATRDMLRPTLDQFKRQAGCA